MNGLLVYDYEGARRNKWFIDRLIECAKKVGLKLTVKYADEPFGGAYVSFAVVRADNADINARYERKGLRVFNNALTAEIANDKWRTYELCNRLGLPVMPTYRTMPERFPVIIKSVNGHGGKEVFWANNELSAMEYERKIAYAGKRFIFQQPCSDIGIDVRLYMMGGDVVAAVERTGADFKSNFSLGGSVRVVEPAAEQVQAAQKIAAHLHSDYIGIDFIRHNGEWVVNEIEDAAGARMLYASSDIDIAEVFAEYIARELQG